MFREEEFEFSPAFCNKIHMFMLQEILCLYCRGYTECHRTLYKKQLMIYFQVLCTSTGFRYLLRLTMRHTYGSLQCTKFNDT